MPNLERGTVVAECECPMCGTMNAVKLNKNGIAYFYCGGLRKAKDALCSAHMKWGKADSQDMQRAYLARKGGGNAAQSAPANDNRKPAGTGKRKPVERDESEGVGNGLFGG